jgi:hypothetical protein
MSKDKDFIIPEQTVNTDGMSREEYMKHRGFSEVKTVTTPDGKKKHTMQCNLYQHFMTSEKGERRANQKALDMWKKMGADPKKMIITAEWDW